MFKVAHSQLNVKKMGWKHHEPNTLEPLKQQIKRIPWGNNKGSLSRLESPTTYHMRD